MTGSLYDTAALKMWSLNLIMHYAHLSAVWQHGSLLILTKVV